MNFHEDFIPLILSGQKTQTRRPVKEGHKPHVAGEILPINGSAENSIRIKAVRIENIRDLSGVGLRHEGVLLEYSGGFSEFVLASLRFYAMWDRLYPEAPYRWHDGPDVWVYDFELVENHG